MPAWLQRVSLNPLEILKATAPKSLIAYTTALRPDYRPAELHQRIARALQKVEAGLTRRLMIFVPPRHGKSMLTSEHFPPWYLGRNPDKSIICATYAQELADDFGRKVRNQMVDPLYGELFPACQVSADSASVSRLATVQHGNYYAVGIGGPLTGRGANVLLIDDPHKGRAEAESALERKKAKDWFQSVAYTRLMDNGAVILMMTRWHEDDLAGWLLKEHADEGWEILEIPADPPPWPERYPEAELTRIRRMVGPREWNALYMQKPVPGGGGEFRREMLRYYSGSVGDGMNKYILCDPAGEQRKENDYTSIWVVGLASDGNYYWLDGIRDRLALHERGREIMRLHRKHRPQEVRYERYGMMADIQYIKELQERENYRFDVVEVAGNKLKKEDRIRRLLPIFADHKFYFPESLYYTDREGVPHDLVSQFTEQEFCAFPAGVHDDMLDSLSRIVEPDLPLVWPMPEEDPEPVLDRYARRRRSVGSSWAA
jgi:predicted phage terminase large subunit-like protein